MSGQQSWQALARSMAAGETFDHSRGWSSNPAYEAKMKAEKEEREQIVKDGIAAMKEKGAATTPEAKAAVQQKLDAINERADNHAKMLGERAERRSRRPVDSYGGRRRKTRKGKKSRRRTTRKH
jgi:hypothetical protein